VIFILRVGAHAGQLILTLNSIQLVSASVAKTKHPLISRDLIYVFFFGDIIFLHSSASPLRALCARFRRVSIFQFFIHASTPVVRVVSTWRSEWRKMANGRQVMK
jgi:hypothetical protein